MGTRAGLDAGMHWRRDRSLSMPEIEHGHLSPQAHTSVSSLTEVSFFLYRVDPLIIFFDIKLCMIVVLFTSVFSVS